jgi:hypothetical protein
MGLGHFSVAAFFAGDFARVASVKMILTAIAFHDFTRPGDAEAFGERFVGFLFHKKRSEYKVRESFCQSSLAPRLA